MINNINIDAAAGFINIEKEIGSDTIILNFKNITGNKQKVELYVGDNFYKILACRVSGSDAAATMPHEVFNGSILHFRLIQNETPGPFFHIVFDKNQEYNFNPLNFVVFSNTKGTTGQFITGSNYNKYLDLHPFTQDQLANFNYKTLREGQL